MPKRITTTKRKMPKKVQETEPIWLRLAKLRYGHYPLTDEDIKRELEALNRFAGSIKTDPEILCAVAMDTDPSRLGLTMEDLEELKRRAEKDASRSS